METREDDKPFAEYAIYNKKYLRCQVPDLPVGLNSGLCVYLYFYIRVHLTENERQCVLVLLSFPSVCPGCSLPLETLADHHHWALQNTILKIILPFPLCFPWSHGVESLWKLQRGSEHHGRKSQLFLSIKQKSLTFYFFYSYLNQNQVAIKEDSVH